MNQDKALIACFAECFDYYCTVFSYLLYDTHTN